MSRAMYDGIDAGRLPTTARIVAGYVDGLYRWSDADWARFPNAVKVRVAVFSQTNDGQVLDCEPGNATPAQSVDWALMRRAAGADPTVYCGQHTWWGQIRAAFQARAVPEPHYWVANYDGSLIVPAGALAKQWYSSDALGYDLSAVPDYWPGVDPAPAPPPVLIPARSSRRNDMHVDLKPNTPVVFTNPAAVLPGTSNLLLASDFGDAVVRVALFQGGSWGVRNYNVNRVSGAIKVALPPTVNKASVELVSGNGAVGLDVLA